MIDITQCIEDAENHKSKLTEEYISKLDGLSSPKVWHLLNNLCAGASSYLEVGCFKGSTLLAALYQNPVYAFAIDNFSMSPETRNDFFKNTDGANFEFYEGDSFGCDLTKIKKPIDVYFFDGCHSVESQYKAISHFIPAMSNDFIIVIDDWDANKVRVGTHTALIDLKIKPIEKYELKGAMGESIEERKAGWWGGLGILRVKK